MPLDTPYRYCTAVPYQTSENDQHASCCTPLDDASINHLLCSSYNMNRSTPSYISLKEMSKERTNELISQRHSSRTDNTGWIFCFLASGRDVVVCNRGLSFGNAFFFAAGLMLGREGRGELKLVWVDSPLNFLTTSLFSASSPSLPLCPPLWLLSTFFGARSYAKSYLQNSLHGQPSWDSCTALSCPPSKAMSRRLNACRRLAGRHLIRMSPR